MPFRLKLEWGLATGANGGFGGRAFECLGITDAEYIPGTRHDRLCCGWNNRRDTEGAASVQSPLSASPNILPFLLYGLHGLYYLRVGTYL